MHNFEIMQFIAFAFEFGQNQKHILLCNQSLSVSEKMELWTLILMTVTKHRPK